MIDFLIAKVVIQFIEQLLAKVPNKYDSVK